MDEKFTFDDVLIEPRFSDVNSRSEVDLKVEIPGIGKFLPIMSSNMDTVTGPEMARTLAKLGAIGCLHRFYTVEENAKEFERVSEARNTNEGDAVNVKLPCAVSFGIGGTEFVRALNLYNAGARLFVLDVAHAAQQQVVDQYRRYKEFFPEGFVIVGNFASVASVEEFINRLGFCPDGIKIGIGPGSACTTRIKTGVGYPQLSAISEIAHFLKVPQWDCFADDGMGKVQEYPNCLIVADGGLKTPGDIAKALGAGADMVMLGGMLSGTTETPGELFHESVQVAPGLHQIKDVKVYRGSASQASYNAQGKTASFRAAEGESFVIPFKGPVKDILQDIEGGLRSAFTYVGARNLKEFQKKVQFVKVSSSTIRENGAHGKK